MLVECEAYLKRSGLWRFRPKIAARRNAWREIKAGAQPDLASCKEMAYELEE